MSILVLKTTDKYKQEFKIDSFVAERLDILNAYTYYDKYTGYIRLVYRYL